MGDLTKGTPHRSSTISKGSVSVVTHLHSPPCTFGLCMYYNINRPTLQHKAPPSLLYSCLASYFSIPQNISVYLSISQYISVYLSIPQYTSVYLSIPQYISVYLSIPQYTSAYLGIPRYTSVYHSIPNILYMYIYITIYISVGTDQ